MRLFIERVGVVLKRSLGLILLLSISGTSVALATLTFGPTSVTMDSFVGFLSGVVGIGATSTSATLYVQAQSAATTTLLVQGFAGQTARLFAVASSSGVNNFEILNTGLASSTNFIAVNASTTNLDISGYLTVSATSTLGTSTVTGLTYGTASGTSLSASSYLNTPTLVATNASTTNVSSTRVTVATTFAVGGGTPITNMACASRSYNLGSITAWATSSVPFTLTGISTSSNQTFQFGFATSSAGFDALQFLGVIASSTNNAANAYVRNNASTTLSSATTTYSLCFTQF